MKYVDIRCFQGKLLFSSIVLTLIKICGKFWEVRNVKYENVASFEDALLYAAHRHKNNCQLYHGTQSVSHGLG